MNAPEFWMFPQVRNSPLYHLIKARALKKLGKTEECLKTLKAAMVLPSIKRARKTAFHL